MQETLQLHTIKTANVVHIMDSSWDAWELSQALSPDFTQLYQTKFYPAAHYVLGHQSRILQVQHTHRNLLIEMEIVLKG